MCMYTSLVERTPGAGRQVNFSSGVASASAINCRDTWRHSPSYPCQIPSGGACASKGRALNKRSRKSVFLMIYLPSGPHHYGQRTQVQVRKRSPFYFVLGVGSMVSFWGLETTGPAPYMRCSRGVTAVSMTRPGRGRPERGKSFWQFEDLAETQRQPTSFSGNPRCSKTVRFDDSAKLNRWESYSWTFSKSFLRSISTHRPCGCSHCRASSAGRGARSYG